MVFNKFGSGYFCVGYPSSYLLDTQVVLATIGGSEGPFGLWMHSVDDCRLVVCIVSIQRSDPHPHFKQEIYYDRLNNLN